MNLLDPWTTAFGLAPFDAISDSDFAPVMASALVHVRLGRQATGGALEEPLWSLQHR